MARQYKDLAETTLASSLTNVATSMSVTSATRFPTGGDFMVELVEGSTRELVLVTAVSGTTFTITRAQGTPATTAAAFTTSALVRLVLDVAGLAAAVTQTKLDDLTAPDDNTDLNASTSSHGLLRKLSGTATDYLDGSGAWSTPGGGGGGGGGGSGLTLLYDYTVTGSDKASIDTQVDDGGNGAAALPTTYSALEIYFVHRTDDAGALANPEMIVNADTGSNYDRQVIRGNNASAVAAQGLAGTSWIWNAHGSGGSSAQASLMTLVIPAYGGTTFNKEGQMIVSMNDATAGNNYAEFWSVNWRSTSAITRIKVNASFSSGTPKFKVGTRLLIYGRTGTTGGNVGSDPLWDAKGDLAVGSASDTADNLAVGANGKVLVAASGETLGLKWDYPSGYQFDYVTNSTRQDFSATTAAGANSFITSNSVTYDGSTAILVEFFSPLVASSQFISFDLWDQGAGTDLGVIHQSNGIVAAAYGALRLTPPAGSNSYQIRAWRGTGTASSENGAGGAGTRVPAYLRITKA